MEHHANLVPWQLLAQERDGDLEFIPITDDGILRLDVFEVLLRLKPKLVAFTHVSNTLGTINPVREMTEMAHAAGALVLDRRGPGRAARAGRRPGAGRRLLRVLRPQDARPDGLGRPVGAARAARGDAAVPGGRRDDPRGPPPPERLQRHPLEVRGGHAGRRRRDRPGRRRRLPERDRDGRRPRARARPRRVQPRDAQGARCPGSSSTARWTRTSAAASSRSTCRASTRTTSPRSSIGRASPSGPGTTARCRSTSAWTSRRRPGRASTSTRLATTSTPSSTGLHDVQRVFGSA